MSVDLTFILKSTMKAIKATPQFFYIRTGGYNFKIDNYKCHLRSFSMTHSTKTIDKDDKLTISIDRCDGTATGAFY